MYSINLNNEKVKNLHDYYTQKSDNLIKDLHNATNLSSQVHTVVNELNKIVGSDSEYVGALTLKEQHFMNYYFNSFFAAFYLLDKVFGEFVQQDSERMYDRDKKKSDLRSHIPIAISSIVSSLVPGGPLVSILSGLITGGSGLLLSDLIEGKSGSEDKHRDETTTKKILADDLMLSEKQILDVVGVIVKNYDKFKEEIDDLCSGEKKENTSKAVGLEQMPDVLRFFYEMLSFNNNQKYLLSALQGYLPVIPKILANYDIEIIEYKQGENDGLFDKQSGSGVDSEMPVMLKPALVKSGEVLFKGVVLVS